jgi:hypothetical protein
MCVQMDNLSHNKSFAGRVEPPAAALVNLTFFGETPLILVELALFRRHIAQAAAVSLTAVRLSDKTQIESKQKQKTLTLHKILTLAITCNYKILVLSFDHPLVSRAPRGTSHGTTDFSVRVCHKVTHVSI